MVLQQDLVKTPSESYIMSKDVHLINRNVR